MTLRTTRSRGFTLVELLVVAGILATLFGLIVTGTQQGPDRQVRHAAQSLISSLMTTQSRALGSAAGAAIILQSGTSPSNIASSLIANASMAPLVTGSAGIHVFTGTVPTSLGVDLWPTNADAEDLLHAYRIRFGGSPTPSGTFQPASAWMSLAVPSGISRNSCSGTASFRIANGQTVGNTIWPTGTTAFTATRYPVISDTVYSFPKLVAIDLRYSGIGEESLGVWGNANYAVGWCGLAAKGSIAIGFDSVGRIDALMQRVTEAASVRTIQPIRPLEPLYLLVNTREWIEDHANEPLNNPNAVWVVVQPLTGRTTSAANIATLGSDATALRTARGKARAGTIGGK